MSDFTSMRENVTLLLLSFLFTPLVSTALAEIPQRMHYQGYLTLAGGEPVECADPTTCSQPIDLTFRIYSDPIADALLWEEDHLNVIVVGGMFNVMLGEEVPITPDLLAGPAFLGVEVNGNEELEPRQELVSTGRAMHCAQALDAAKLGGVAASGYVNTADFTVAVEALEAKIAELEDVIAQGGSGGGNGEDPNTPLINGAHTAGECVEAGGIVTDIPGNQKLCRFIGSSCGPGWTQEENWCTTSFLFCTGTSPSICGPPKTCTAQRHPFANEPPGSCSVFNYCEDNFNGDDFCLGKCGTSTCTNEVTEMGCF